MADIKSINKDSSLNFKAIIREFRGYIVDPTKVHVKGKFFTASAPVHEFEIDKGTATGCVLDGFMLAFNLDISSFREGRMRCATVIYQKGGAVGTTSTANEQFVPIQIVPSGTSTNTDQGPFVIDIILYTSITDADILVWNRPVPLPVNPDVPVVSPTLADVQKMVDNYMRGFFYSPAFAALMKSLNFANGDLSNVSPVSLLALAKLAGLAENTLVDVDLLKLQEKGNAAGLMNKDLSNVPLKLFNREVRQSAAYQKLANMPHPATQGRTDDQIRALFMANRFEEQKGVDLTSGDYTKATTLMMAYQMSDGQTIQQTLPPVSDNRIIWVELIREPGATGYKTVISPKQGDQINGTSTPVTMDADSPEYIFIPVLNENTWEAIPHNRYNKSNLSGHDDFGTIIDAIDKLYFRKPLKLKWNDETKEVELSVEGDMEMSFVDTVLKKNFKAALGQSMDGSIRISMIPKGKGDNGEDIFVVDFSVAKTSSQEGVARVAEYTQLVNFAYPDNQPRFANVLYPGGSAVRTDDTTGGVIVEEIDLKDPNVTGGTLFLAVLDYSPDRSQDNVLTQDGKIILALTDKDGNYITTENGEAAAVERTYQAGQEVEAMRLAVLFRAKGSQEVFYRLVGTFDQEEAVSVGLGSGMCIQAIEPDSGIGDALMAYEVYTGSHVEIGKVNYSTNNINFARVVTKDSITVIGGDMTDNLGNNLFFDARSSITKQIANYGLRIQASQMPCAFSLYQIYSKVDLIRLKGCFNDMSVKLKNKQGAMRLVMLGYKGADPSVSPKLLSFSNDQPQYNAGWEEIDNLFIAENALSDMHKETKSFTFPVVEDGYSACAFLLRPDSEAVPVDVTIYDMEGDIRPGFVFAAIKEQYRPGQMALARMDLFTKSAIMCPIGLEAYRFTIGNTPTKIPVGIFKQNGFVRNNNAWFDPGSSGKEYQGDIDITKSFRGNLSYSLNLYNETDTDNPVTFWIAKVETDGSFTKVPDSELVVTVKAKTLPPASNEVTLPSFPYNYKKGESYRWLAETDKAGGAFIQCNNGSHIPMTELIFDVEYYTEIPEDTIHGSGLAAIEYMDGDKPVDDPSLYKLQVDVKTFDVKVVKVK